MEKEQNKDRSQAFVDYVIKRLESDKAMGAKLRRADNPATEIQSWEYLAPWVNLEYVRERKTFATVAAALARAKPRADGGMGLGRAIASAYADKKESDGKPNQQATARLRRLLACDTTEEACDILRPLLQLVCSRGANLCYAQLLRDLLTFPGKTRERWAQDFFRSTVPELTEEE